MSRISKTVFVKAGKWRTLETHWSRAKIRFYFRNPPGAKIRARYGFGWLSKNRQTQTLDGSSEKKISIGTWGLTRAKVQMKTLNDSNVIYDVEVIGP
ncbi:hypothetical protein DYD21_11720 [Rhodohalobacter sp. SW132]|uniref:hypothetical protein n=1 Tax=Rhodohalobacter sp. SW132 TaxID=2293433 RepID=UPI000E372C0B|nr:hypothetical protein [Rhodohalobacter sp. SW132]REL33433.1 hypothetical protein DYD21_11720 [Rhodohalobacter sp. SW132]